MKHWQNLLLLTALLALSGCDSLSSPTSPVETLPAETAPTFATYQVMVTDPLSTPTQGAVPVVDGVTLESPAVWFDELCYVPGEAFLSSLNGNILSGSDEEGFTLTWNGTTHRFDETTGAIRWDNRMYLPLKSVCQTLELSFLDDPEENRFYCTSGISSWDIPQRIRVPVLMYHAVTSEVWGNESLFVDPDVLERHFQYLLEEGYTPIFFEDLNHVTDYEKPVILTFDDGYLDNYEQLYPLLQAYQFKATIFVVTSSMDNRVTSMTSQQVKELSDSGLVSIQSHTVNHQVLTTLSPEEQEEELRQSKLAVARMTGREPFVVSYPTGAYTDTTRALAEEYYRFAVTVEEGDFITGRKESEIPRYYVRRSTTMEQWIQMLQHAGQEAHWPFW